MKNSVVLINTDIIDCFGEFPIRTMEKIPPQIPLGLCYLAAVLENNGISVSIIDNYVHGYSSQILSEKILKRRPYIVGFSTTTQNSFQAFETAELIKKSNPDIKIVFGGIHASVLPYKVMRNKNVDYVIIGEGEYALLELVKAVVKGEGKISGIRGLFFRKSDGEIGYNSNRSLIANLDELPFPARHLVDLKDYSEDSAIFGVERLVSLNTSRGCPFHCAFCSSSSYWNRKFRARTPTNIVDEIEFLIKKYNADGIRFREDNFTVNRKRVIAICEEIQRRNIIIPLECESRVDTINKEILIRMKEAGCRAIWFGVESGSQKTLDFLNKGTTLSQTRKVFEWCHNLGIATGATFMLGVPGETREDVLQTLNFALEIAPDWASFQAYLGLPTSQLYYYVLEHKMCFKKIGDICVVETNQLSFNEIVELENLLNEEFIRFEKLGKSKNLFVRFLIKRLPFVILKKINSLYKFFPFSIRKKIKSLI